MKLIDFYNTAKELSKKERKLNPNEVGCVNCTRWGAGSLRCDLCYGFSEFKSKEMVNEELREKGLDYLCV